MQVMEMFPIPVFIEKASGIDNPPMSRLIYAIQQEELAAGTADKTGFSNIDGFRSYEILQRPGFEPLNERILKGKWYLEDATRSFYRSVQAEVFKVTPQEGLLVMFPSWFEHSVKAKQSDEGRISIAFNIRRQELPGPR